MDNSKNLVIAIILSVVVLAGWQFIDNYRVNGDFYNFQRKPLGATSTVNTNTPVANNQAADGTTTNFDIGAPSLDGNSTSQNGAEETTSYSRDSIIRESTQKGERITLNTPHLKGSINLNGARIDDITLLNYREELSDDSPLVNFLQPSGSKQSYFAEFGWVADPSLKGIVSLPDGKSIWQASSNSLNVDKPVTLTWTSPEAVVFKQTIAVDPDYLFTITQDIVDKNGILSGMITDKISTYGRISRNGVPENLSQLYILHEGLIGYLNGGLEEVNYDDINEAEGRIKRWESTEGWLGITDKYWLAALIPNQTTPFSARMLSSSLVRGSEELRDNQYQADLVMKLQSTQQVTQLFVGAKITTLLDRYKDAGIAKFDLAVDYGWFYFLTKPIFYALHWLNAVIGNFGVSILVLTIIIKGILYPLANKSYASMSKMKLLQPKMLELRERYGEDKQRLNQAMMELYKNEKINPLSGCLPILIQIPIFFSLYKVLYVTIEMRHAPFFGWIQDLSAPDPLRFLNLFGLVPWEVPPILMVINIGIWPILMGISMWAQMRLNPTPADPIQQKIFTFMPIIFTFMLANFAAGLVIYWTWNNILSMTQQYVIMKRMGVAVGGGREKKTA